MRWVLRQDGQAPWERAALALVVAMPVVICAAFVALGALRPDPLPLLVNSPCMLTEPPGGVVLAAFRLDADAAWDDLDLRGGGPWTIHGAIVECAPAEPPWRPGIVAAPIGERDLTDVGTTLREALGEYRHAPALFGATGVRRVWLADGVTVDGEGCAGLYSPTRAEIILDVRSRGLRTTIHHEIAHHVFHATLSSSARAQWEHCRGGFSYAPDSVVPFGWRVGLADSYGATNPHEEFATLAEWAFVPPSDLPRMLRESWPLLHKLRVLDRIYEDVGVAIPIRDLVAER